jgi:hypothetical protein
VASFPSRLKASGHSFILVWLIESVFDPQLMLGQALSEPEKNIIADKGTHLRTHGKGEKSTKAAAHARTPLVVNAKVVDKDEVGSDASEDLTRGCQVNVFLDDGPAFITVVPYGCA